MSDWMSGLHREVRDAARALLAEGWEYDRTSGKSHPRIRWPASGEILSLPGTPSDHRSIPNMLAAARRISGVKPETHRSPKFRSVRGSGFDLERAARDSAERTRRAEPLRARLAEIRTQLASSECNPRTRAVLVELAREQLRIEAELSALGVAA